MRKKRVLLFSEGFGTGHTGAAHALAEGIKRLNPDVQCRVIELGKFLNPTVAPWILSAYRKTVSRQPKLVGMMYKTHYDKSLSRLTRLALHRVFYNHTLQVIRQLKPDLIICSHPIPAAVISRLKQQGLEVPLFVLITDYDAHASWVNDEANRYLVSTPLVRTILSDRGVPQERISVTGIPVHPKFWESAGKKQLRKELGLADIPTVLIMGGGWGLIFGEELMNTLTSRMDEIQLIFCMGSNDKLMNKMLADPAMHHPNVRIIGFSNEVNKLMDASDLLITKPGGMTCTEAQAKGIPMLFCEAIPGQEEKNCEYFVELGVAEVMTPQVVNQWFNRLIRKYSGQEDHIRFRPAAEIKQQPAHCATTVLQLLGKPADMAGHARSQRARGEEAVYVVP